MRAPDFWQAGPTAAIGHLLSPLGALYATATTLRASRAPQWTAPVPVICIGNLVMGGAGKTLIGLNLIQHLTREGYTPHVLLRGYGGNLSGATRVDPDTHTHHDVGDEALLYAEHATTWTGADRVASAKAAVDAGADVIVMDDGFQNPDLAKTLSLLVFDGHYGIGNGYGFPAGPMREFLRSGIKRADAIIGIGHLPGSILSAADNKPVFSAATVPTADSTSLSGKRVLAFAGIGRPQKFFDSLAAVGANIVHRTAFPDHHAYADTEIQILKKEADIKAAQLVTTTKDFVRLGKDVRKHVQPFAVDIEWQNQTAVLDFISSAIGGNTAHA